MVGAAASPELAWSTSGSCRLTYSSRGWPTSPCQRPWSHQGGREVEGLGRDSQPCRKVKKTLSKWNSPEWRPEAIEGGSTTLQSLWLAQSSRDLGQGNSFTSESLSSHNCRMGTEIAPS